MIVPEPCSEERLEELLATAKGWPRTVSSPSREELAWLVTEARVAARLGAELEEERREHQATLRLSAAERDLREALENSGPKLTAQEHGFPFCGNCGSKLP